MSIIFGTDGWRGLIARDFTFENIRYVALATARFIKNEFKDEEQPSVVIGYDTRFLSREFAEETASVLASEGILVHLTDSISSTPQVSYHTKQKNASLGVIITASHNPAKYSGYKVKANFGGPATPEQVKELEKYLNRILGRPPQINLKSVQEYIDSKMIKLFDAKEPFVRHIKKKINVAAIKEAGFKVIYDPMHGSGIQTISHLLPGADEIHGEHNPGFGNVDHPEPIENCLPELINRIKSGKYDVGLATDGDADRLGVVDGDGNFVDAHKVFMMLLKYLYENKHKRGAVVKTVSLTSMVDKYCTKNKIKLYETPVGFKHTAKLMNEEIVLIGGEESGGLGTIIHIPERDGLFNGMLLLEAMAVKKMSLKELCKELDDELGMHRFRRRDVYVTPKQKEDILGASAKAPKRLGRFDVQSINTKDGYKFIIENGWLLIRASGTEPLIRFYAEAENLNIVNELLDAGMNLK